MSGHLENIRKNKTEFRYTWGTADTSFRA